MAEGPEWTPADVADAVRIGVNAGRAVARRDAIADARVVVLEELSTFFDTVRDRLDSLAADGDLADDGHDYGWNTAGDEPRCSRMDTP